jgi:hypothetical protein
LGPAAAGACDEDASDAGIAEAVAAPDGVAGADAAGETRL